MFKALTFGVLCAAVSALRVDSPTHDELTWTDATNLTDKQKEWDNFFRGQIKALGDSKAQKVSGDNNFQYLDTTPPNGSNEVVAWDVEGAVKADNNWEVKKIIQVKTYTDKSNDKVSYITKTTYQRNNLPAVTSQEFAQ